MVIVKDGRPKQILTFLLQPNISIAINPPMVYGPVIRHVGDPKSLNTSAADIYRLIDGSQSEVPPTTVWAFADVRDGKWQTVSVKLHRFANVLGM